MNNFTWIKKQVTFLLQEYLQNNGALKMIKEYLKHKNKRCELKNIEALNLIKIWLEKQCTKSN